MIDLEGLFGPSQDWRKQAACRNENPDTFWPSEGDIAAEQAAKAVCARCVVKEDCLEFALLQYPINKESIMGGTNQVEREVILVERNRRS